MFTRFALVLIAAAAVSSAGAATHHAASQAAIAAQIKADVATIVDGINSKNIVKATKFDAPDLVSMESGREPSVGAKADHDGLAMTFKYAPSWHLTKVDETVDVSKSGDMCFWSRVWKSIAEVADRLTARRPDPAVAYGAYGMRTVAFTQALLAIAVVGLVADRATIWMTPDPTPSPVVQTASLPASPPAETARLEQQLDEVARMQAKIGEALASQQNGIVQLHQAVAKLSSTQESVASSVVMVKEEVKEELEKRLEAVGREADRTTRHVANKGRIEQEQLEAAIHSLTADNDRLSKEVAGLEENNQSLKAKLQTAVANVPKAADPSPERLLKMADSMQGNQQPFLFWVTFSEGTSQESIDQWVNGMKGHKGALNEGWQEVRIIPPPVPPDRFLEQIRGEKIIKAARINQ